MVCTHCGHRALPQQVGLRPGDGAAQFHECPALGILAPLLPEGLSAKVEKREREDYEGTDHGALRLDSDGRPIANIQTIRDDGEDCVVFAPLAKVISYD